jgi:phenylacetyl-CoA:acceptor oxidoreductase subunit 2
MDGSVPRRQTSWDWRAAGNYTFGGAGSGLAFTAALLTLATGQHVIAAFLLAPLLIGAGIALVWAELGRPKQYLQVFFHPQTSWKTREALLAPVVAVVTLVAALLPFSLVLLLVLLASGGFLYAQARSLGEGDNIPVWRDRRIVPLILGTGVTEGAALLTVVATLTFSDDALPALRLAFLLAVVRWPVWTAYRDALAGGAPRAFRERRVAVVLCVPAVLLALAAVLPVFAGLVAVIGGVAAAMAGWWLKYVIIAAPETD